MNRQIMAVQGSKAFWVTFKLFTAEITHRFQAMYFCQNT
jgi:hypothetical protein